MTRTDSGVDAFIGNMDRWQEEFILLRALCLEAGLEEGLKWRQPCYMADGKNVVVLQGFKKDCALGFFQGVLMKDPAAFSEDGAYEAAFSSLTSGRQRGYLLHFSGSKQSATRTARIEKHRERNLLGKGLQDR